MLIPREALFWSRVDMSGGVDACWPWLGGRNRDNYGRFSVNGSMWLANRIAWIATHGRMPPDDKPLVLHHCDNPPCCNPRHLWVGTNEDNRRDSVSKGRTAIGDRNGSRRHPERRATGDRHGTKTHPGCMPKGLDHWMYRNPSKIARGEALASKLTDEAVRAIRARWKEFGRGQKQIGAEFGVTQGMVSMIVLRKVWKHVK